MEAYGPAQRRRAHLGGHRGRGRGRRRSRASPRPQVALAWVAAQPAVTSVILGARTVEQLNDNLAAADLDLTADAARPPHRGQRARRWTTTPTATPASPSATAASADPPDLLASAAHVAPSRGGRRASGRVCSVVSVTEQQAYSVVQSYAAFELRRYPAHVVAEVTVNGAFEDAGNLAFRTLLGYISGQNTSAQKLEMTAPVVQEQDKQRSQKLAMTAPVEQTEVAQGEHRIAFVLPASVTPETAPVPTNPQVHVRAVPERFTAAAALLRPVERVRLPLAPRRARLGHRGGGPHPDRRAPLCPLRPALQAVVPAPQRGRAGRDAPRRRLTRPPDDRWLSPGDLETAHPRSQPGPSRTNGRRPSPTRAPARRRQSAGAGSQTTSSSSR